MLIEEQAKQAPTLRPLTWSVFVTVEAPHQSVRRVRTDYLPECLWPLLAYSGREKCSTDESPAYWAHQWTGLLGQSEFDVVWRAIGPEYLGREGGMFGAPGFHGLVPDIRWEGHSGDVRIAACPFPAELDTAELRHAWDFGEWEAIIREFEAAYGLADRE